MKNHHRQLIGSFFLGLLGLVLTPVCRAGGPYHFIKEIPIGGEGGWDYLSVDPASHRLYVSHATKVVVVDTAKDEVVGEIADTPGIHGVAIAPELNRGFASNGRETRRASLTSRR